MVTRVVRGLALVALAALVGCSPSGAGGSAVAEAATEPPTAPAATSEPPAEAPAEAEPTAEAESRYWGLRFELLPEQMQARFLELASAELCPCEGQIASLDDCLKTEATSCELAMQAAAIMMELVAINAESVQVTDAVQEFVRNARAVHEFQLEGVPYEGAEEPELVLVEFYDFECPHCKHLSEAWPPLLEEFGDRIRVYHKQFPLQSHPNAAAASVAALAAHRQGRYFEFHEQVFANQARLQATADPQPLLRGWAEQIGLNMERFEADLADPAVAAEVQRDRQEGLDAGLMGTPAIYIDGVMLMSGYDLPSLQATLRDRLAN